MVQILLFCGNIGTTATPCYDVWTIYARLTLQPNPKSLIPSNCSCGDFHATSVGTRVSVIDRLH